MSAPDPAEVRARSIAQFFFEIGFGACFAEAMIRNDMKPPFEFTDALVEGAWPRAIEAHEDPAEMDRYLTRANDPLAPAALHPPASVAEVERMREALIDLADAARSACDAKQHQSLIEALFEADALIALSQPVEAQ